MRRSSFIRALTATLAFVVGFTGRASADLDWFGRSDPTRPEPIRLSEIVAWSDACLAIREEEWDEVVRLHRVYVGGWRVPEGTTGRDAAADRRFLEELSSFLTTRSGPDRSACMEAMRAWREVPTRLANDPQSAAKLRREVLHLAASPKDGAPEDRLRAQQLAGALCRRLASAVGRGATRPSDELAVLVRAMLPLRSSLVEMLGQERADRLQRTIALRADLVQPILHGTKVRTLLAMADRLTPEERTRVAEAFGRADASIDAIVLEGRGLPQAERDDPERAAAERSGFERAWLTARGAGERALAGELREILGAARFGALQALGLEGVRPLPATEEGNAMADAAIATFIDPTRLDDLAAALGAAPGGRPWHPVEILPFGEDELVALRVPRAWSIELLRAAIEPARLDDAALAVIDGMHAAHVARVRALESAMPSGGGPADFALREAMAREDEAILAELVAALGEEASPAPRRALALLARAERGFAPDPRGANWQSCWIVAPGRGSGSIALLALGVGEPQALRLDAAGQLALVEVLAPAADALRRTLAATAVVAPEGTPPLAIAGRDAAWTLAWFEGLRRVLEGVLEGVLDGVGGGGVDAAQAARIARTIDLAAIEPVFDGSSAAVRLAGALALLRDGERAQLATAAESRLLDFSTDPRRSLQFRIEACRAVAALASRPDDEKVRIDACEASRSAVMASHGLAWRRESAIADAWRVLRAAGVAEAQDAFRP